MRLFILFAPLVVSWLCATVAEAHELRPAFLDMKETSTDHYAIVWKLPALGDQRLALTVLLPDQCRELKPPVNTLEDYYIISRWPVTCEGGVKGGVIGIEGLPTTLTDVLVRIEYADGSTQVERLTPAAFSFTASGTMTWQDAAVTYFILGVEHILKGLDHLLFVLSLMLLIRGRTMLFKTITAFTLAHSITLAGSALGFLWLPQSPVEACVALSIVFVAAELVRAVRGETGLAMNRPWLVAFIFGLLHGFGFAGALREIGLPQKDMALSLLSFNLGVEAGQVLFVAAVLMLWTVLQRLIIIPARGGRLAAAYGIGTVASVWLISRIAIF